MTPRDFTTLIACDYCGAQAGQWCRAKGGTRASYPHGVRQNVVYEIWLDGFYEGQEDLIYFVDKPDPYGERYVQTVRDRLAAKRGVAS